MFVGLKLPILTTMLFCSPNILSMIMIPERVAVEYVDENYVTELICNVRRYGRNSGYYVNIEGTIKHTWANNVSFHVVLYEFLHNEYKRTFIEFHFKHVCDMLNSDPYVGLAVKNAGAPCPAPPGHYLLANMTIPFDDFPYKMPFERAKGTGTVTIGNVTMASASLYMKFVQNKKGKKM